MASLRDIAQRVGVSISVVSRVLRNNMGKTRVRPAVAAEIRRVADELGYVPNPSAVALIRGRQNALGVFIHRIGVEGSGIVEALLDGISEGAREGHQRLIVAFFSTAEEFEEISEVVRNGFVDGLLLAGRAHAELIPRVTALHEGGLPIVTLHHSGLWPSIPNVGIDQRELGRLATAHLIEQGCRRIVLPLPTARLTNAQGMPAQRVAGYHAAHMDSGMAADPALSLDLHGMMDYDSGARAATELLDAGTAFDGIFAQSDAQALAFVNELAHRNHEIPRAVKIVGVDDSPLCRMVRIPLTSISQRYFERARRAIEILREAIAGRPVASEIFAPELRVRASTAAGE